jgi:hypothetical protein
VRLDELIMEAVRDADWSFRRIAQATRGEISPSGVHRLSTPDGIHNDPPKTSTIIALADVLGYSRRAVWDSVGESLHMFTDDDETLTRAGLLPPGWQKLRGRRFETLRNVAAILVSDHQAEDRIVELEAKVAELEAQALGPGSTKPARRPRRQP